MTISLLLALAGIMGVVLVLLVRARPIFFICLTAYSLVLSQSFPITYIGERPVNISTDYILIPFLLVAWLLSRIKKARIQILPSFARPYLLFSIWIVITLLLSIFRHGLKENLPALIETSKWFMYTLLLLPCLEFIRNTNRARTVLKHLSIAAFLVIIIGYVQWFFLPGRAAANIVSTFSSLARKDVITTKNSFAIYVSMGWLVIIALFLKRRINMRWGWVLLGAFGVLALWSLSRSALLGMLVGLAWLAFTATTSAFKKFYAPRRLGSLIAAIGILFVVTFVYSARQGFHEHTPLGRMTSLFDDSSMSSSALSVAERKTKFKEGIHAFLERPLEGYGFHARAIEFPDLIIVDNFFLDVAIDTGIVGLLLMLWLLISTLAFVWRIRYVSLRLNAPHLGAWAWGTGGALVCLYFSGISGSIPYVGRILGTVVIGLACIASWQKEVYREPLPYI